MLTSDDLWLAEESPIDEPSDLSTIPEIRQHVAHNLRDEDLGLRSLLETGDPPRPRRNAA
jgi:hypothetical protein